ncbi:hypothetical protein AXF42_Ash009454 [Apostasia shenzhenica]|uniref:Uncharacterized protein n=1 Tax=Apostasia shenzhenica TaxID=1088818 RepID=A0A2I0B8U9_9ASPA|nr:hypothetical protein AXF42_Ash009454 [Apostasia shenzhenica]
MAAMSFVSALCIFQLTRNVFTNPDVRVNKARRSSAVPENREEGYRYSQHCFRKYLSGRRPEIFPAVNNFFSKADDSTK